MKKYTFQPPTPDELGSWWKPVTLLVLLFTVGLVGLAVLG